MKIHPADLGIFVTDGVTEALENDGRPPLEQLEAVLGQLAPRITPEIACDEVMRLALSASGPADVDGWQDDCTVVAFVVDESRC
jgi:serine phosphatase RsbU (regulator of sigma subunit)